jgi:hypothetical protein
VGNRTLDGYSDAHGQRDIDQLPQLLRHRRRRADEIVSGIRDRLGIELVAGFTRVVSGREVTSYDGRGPIAAATHLADAHLVPLRAGAELEWETAPVPHGVGQRRVVFAFPMAMGNGSPLPQPGGTFALHLDDRRLLRFTLTKDSQTWEAGGCRLRFDVRRLDATAFGERLTLDHQLDAESVFVDGMGFLAVAPELVTEGRPARLRVVAEAREDSRNWFRVGQSLFPLMTDHLEPGLTDVLRERRPDVVDGRQLLYADLHSHSAESALLGGDGCGTGSRDDLFRFARDVAGLDVFTLSEHDWQLGPDDWEALAALNEKFDDAGAFVTLPGFEWTSANHGHRNVYFRAAGAERFDSFLPGSPRNTIEDGAPTPRHLWRYLDRQGIPAVTVPHHMSVAWFPLSLEHFHNPRYDRVAEIYSTWGDSLQHGQPVTMYADRVPELAFVESIRAGYQVGFIGSSDSHDGRPGAAQGSASHAHLFHHLGSGRAAILADGFDRESVFDAIQARRCYAVTGPRIAVDLSLEGHAMGSSVPASALPARRALDIDVRTAAPIERLEIFRDGERCDVLTGGRRHERFRWVDPRPSDAPTSSYFVKVTRADHECAWTSPIWIQR